MRKPVAIVSVIAALGLIGAGCGGDDEEPTTTTTAPLTGPTGLTGASGATGASGGVSRIEQSLEDGGFVVESGDRASLTASLPSGDVKATEKLDVTGGGLSSTSFVAEYESDEDAKAVFDQYEAENILVAEQDGPIVFSAPTESDLELLVDAAKSG